MLHGGLVPVWLLVAAMVGDQPKAAPKPLGSMTAAEAEAMAAEIGKTVEELRGLKFKRPVPVKVVDDAAARAHFQARAARFWPEAQARLEQKAYAQLGVIPPGTDVMATLLDLLEEQAGGYYDPETQTFFVLADMPRSMAPMIMAHELTHALDDQHFDIDSILEKVGGDDDRQAAVGAVVEGSGTLVMSVFLMREVTDGRIQTDALLEFQESEAGRAARLLEAPVFLQRALVAPYILGQTFLLRGQFMALMAGVQSKDLDRAFRELPTSFEQILHPEKYWEPAEHDPPRPVSLPDLAPALGPGWSLAAKGTLGELVLGVLVGADQVQLQGLAVANPGSWTNSAAAGWGGDLYHHYVAGGRSLTVLGTVWDTAPDAEEFEAALRPVEGRRSWRRGAAVVLVGGDPVEDTASLAAKALDALAPPTPPR